MKYFIKCTGYTASERNFTVGKCYEVIGSTVTSDDGFNYTFNRFDTMSMKDRCEAIIGWFKPWYKFELVKDATDKVVITTDGVKVVTATKYEDGKAVKTATAKCAPEDTFDFMVGAKLAMERLNEPPKPKYYNGKVVCIRTAYPWWTVGKVYEVKNGVIVADDCTAYPPKWVEPYRDVDEVRHAGQGESNRYNSKNEFIPFVEG